MSPSCSKCLGNMTWLAANKQELRRPMSGLLVLPSPLDSLRNTPFNWSLRRSSLTIPHLMTGRRAQGFLINRKHTPSGPVRESYLPCPPLVCPQAKGTGAALADFCPARESRVLSTGQKSAETRSASFVCLDDGTRTNPIL